MTSKLTLADIADLRAYERERDAFRDHIIELKRRRRISVGNIVTLVFENRDTVRFQVQEMARAERMLTDEKIQGELDVYNALIPSPGQLSATLFIELTSKLALMDWLPRLVGIERAVEIVIGDGDDAVAVPSIPEASHEAHLTREAVTASVHYVRWELGSDQIDRFAADPVAIRVNHPEYTETTPLSPESKAELLSDLRG